MRPPRLPDIAFPQPLAGGAQSASNQHDAGKCSACRSRRRYEPTIGSRRSRQWLACVAASLFACGALAHQDSNNPSSMQWAPSRTYHVKNYKLALHFSQSKGDVFGDELVTIKPFEPNFKTFCINSTELNIDSVALIKKNGSAENLAHSTDDHCLWITLDRSYGPDDTLDIRIVYHGHPRAGLYFVNPDRYSPKTPAEIYTEGEPELNHYWFPCWDYPNDMATSETITTVPEGQVVVSNGALKSVTHANGQVTYDWVESIPHSTYLLSLAIGPWKQLHDSYKGKPVDYFVASTIDDAVALRTFHLTPDMIGFFSRATGVEYPFEKYDQVAVHNFIFGGEENVSATTLLDETMHDAKAEPDYPSTILVAHELGQHWFGDYVQGRDWANIWLNEGFATYLTALYTQYHDGNDAYRYEIYDDQNQSMQVEQERHHRPIVDRHYTDPMDTLEEITHDKGASVLDMMRHVLDGGDAMKAPASQAESMFQALNDYLVSHHAQTADTMDLLGSIRDRTGKDLGWFFYEWVFKGGYPDYQVSARYDAARKMEIVKIAQRQQINDNVPVFDMPIQLAFFGEGNQHVEKQIRDNSVEQEFDVPVPFAPTWVDFDPNDILYKTVSFDKTTNELIAEAEKDPYMMSRLWAAGQLGEKAKADDGDCIEALTTVLNNDPFYGVRIEAARGLGQSKSDGAKQALLAAMTQANGQVRAAAIAAMHNFLHDQTVREMMLKSLRDDPSYAVQAAAAEQLGHSGMPNVVDVLRSAISPPNDPDFSAQAYVVKTGVLKGLTATNDPKAARIVLSYAQPGVPERIRGSALSDLPALKDPIERSEAGELNKTVRAALDDSYLETHELGIHLVDVFQLKPFRPDVERDAKAAVMPDDRDEAKRILQRLGSN